MVAPLRAASIVGQRRAGPLLSAAVSEACLSAMTHPLPPQPRPMGAVNWVGLKTLYTKEVYRFLKVFHPDRRRPGGDHAAVLRDSSRWRWRHRRRAGDVPFLQFLAPGLVMMSMVTERVSPTPPPR